MEACGAPSHIGTPPAAAFGKGKNSKLPQNMSKGMHTLLSHGWDLVNHRITELPRLEETSKII